MPDRTSAHAKEAAADLIIDSATDYAIFSTDLQGRVTFWNLGAQRLLGYSEGEIMGQSARVIFTDEDRAAGAPEREMATAMKDGRASDDRLHQRKDGSRFWASGVMMLMHDAQGHPVGLVKILRDQTATRSAQEALERSQAELHAANLAKDRFLAVLSHELRNPLASIESAAGLLTEPKLSDQDRHLAAHIVRRQALAMKVMLADLLDVTRLNLGRLTLHREKVTLADAVAAALETTRPLLEVARHSLEVDLPDHSIELDADPQRLAQVLSNLLGNSIKYTPPGGTIVLSARMTDDDDQVTIKVADNGIGMEPDTIERMFEMFEQAQQIGERSQVGLGIGLALARNIVQLHGGHIEARSEGTGQGSEFCVTLPAKRGPVQPGNAATLLSTNADAPAPTAASPKRGLILIADDNIDAGWGISKLLEIAGYATVHVRGGIEAVKEAQRRRPDVGIIDIGMPDLSGHEVVRQIRQTEWGKQMVLIAATGWGQPSDEREAQAAGFDVHMTKPVDLRKLSAVVDELLARKRR